MRPNEIKAWAVFLNGKHLGIVESNFPFASAYWARKCTPKSKYTLRPVNF